MRPLFLDRGTASGGEAHFASAVRFLRCGAHAATLFGASWLIAIAGLADAQSSTQRVNSEATLAGLSDHAQLKQDEVRLWAVLAKDPGDAGALAGMAWIRSRQGNYLAAISFLEHAKLRRPHDSSLDAALRLDRYGFFMGEAVSALAKGDIATAHSRYGSALQIFPRDGAAYRGFQNTRGKPLATR